MVSDDRCAKSLKYLAESDETAADLKVQVEKKEYLVDLARKHGFLISEGNIEERKAQAELAKPAMTAHDEYLAAMLEYERVKAKRQTEALIVDVWRTVQANRRTGNV